MPQPEYPNHTRPDPVLGFEAADGSDSPEDQHHQRGGGFESMPVIDAVPISMVAPEDVLPEPTPKVARWRSMEEMAKRPEWLPEDWRIDLRVRTSGASTGLIDRYFFDPSGRKFRSKHEVLHFLGTGKKLKRNADDVLSGSKKSKYSSSIPLGGLNNVQANSPQRT
ncbi:methyl-CpG-binding domain-containing protein 6-like isoform X1 [Primulina huaijiensis]|uniref:methyl-CpG-binding domain-containing protein 6-like isoform X1 n=1 Tax=Primulina huaijiensis TaxID=1492673 RepID=UPI003CC73D04